jgi:hypothetical protein
MRLPSFSQEDAMTYRGHVKNGQIALDEAASLPEGAEVNVQVIEHDTSQTSGDGLSKLLMRHAGKGRDLPTDLAAEHDHYAHGKPKRGLKPAPIAFIA